MTINHFPRGAPGVSNTHAYPDAKWWDPAKLSEHEKWQYRVGDIFVGYCQSERVGVSDDRHMVTVAGSRAGKGRSVIVPNMCLYPGSVVVIDPKGDLATITAARRGRGSINCDGMDQDVYVLDPFHVAQENAVDYRASFNPLESINPDGPDGRDDAALVADALIIPSKTELHWTDAAKLLLTGLILHVCDRYEGTEKTVIKVRELLSGDEDAFTGLLAEMSCSLTAGGAVARTANSLVAMSDRERSGVVSTAIVQTEFLDSPAMQEVLCGSDFTLADLKDRPCTVYLSLPAGRMGTHSRWLRLIVALTIEAMERNRRKPEHPVLIIMDEFHSLGSMQVIERAAGQIAGFGVRLWPILQDLNQLKALYPQSWETFLGNAGLTQWFGINDLTTLEYLSKRLGQTTIKTISQGEVSVGQVANGFSGQSKSHQIVGLMTAEEIGRYFSRQSNRQIVLWPGTDPIVVERAFYDQSEQFRNKFDFDPSFKDCEHGKNQEA